MVVHNQDHQPHRLCIYCPVLYYTTFSKTMGDPEVYTEVTLSEEQVKQEIENAIPVSYTHLTLPTKRIV